MCFAFLTLFIFGIITSKEKLNNDDLTPVDYVNNMIGTISQLLVPCYHTIHLPNSMLRLYPDRKVIFFHFISYFPSVI
jgi:hypothetical protein